MLKLFESHCHLNDPAFVQDLDCVVKRANAAGIAGIMVVGTDLESSLKAVSISQSRPGIFASVGVHPHEAQSCSEPVMQKLIKLAASPNVRAWGEIGLDFNRMHSPKADQETWFIRQLHIADETALPVIFHERDSEGRFLEILKAHYDPERMNGVIHCFSGTRMELFDYLDLGLHIGITGVVTHQARGAALRELLPLIPSQNLLIETDSPYLTPAPERNRIRRNEPAFVRSVLIKTAEVRGDTPESLAPIIWENSCRLFNIFEFPESGIGIG